MKYSGYFGIRPEWKYTNLKWHLGFDLRYEQQFEVQAKTSGSIFVASITYLKLTPLLSVLTGAGITPLKPASSSVFPS